MRFKRENMFIIGIPPPPRAPNMITISHLLKPFVESIIPFSPNGEGQTIPTYHHPDGILLQVAAALPLLADLEAVRKLAGFQSHSATMFCSFCTLPSTNIEELDPQQWQLRNGLEVRNQADGWLHATTKSDRNARARSTGVRWTPLHLLPYWDPVRHVVLGYMHNWLEGILQHQLRRLWNIETRSNAERNYHYDSQVGLLSSQTDEGSVSESSAYSSDMQDQATPPPSSLSPSVRASSGTPTPRGTPTHTLSSVSSMTAPTPMQATDSNFSDVADQDSEPIALYRVSRVSSDASDMSAPGNLTGVLHSQNTIHPSNHSHPAEFQFTENELRLIRTCVADISLPTWIDRPPTNLGDPGHGKLKAETYLTLFSFIFPLIIPELWYSSYMTDRQKLLLQSFHNLVAATNIIISFKTSHSDADHFLRFYIQYRQSIHQLFPGRSVPNHHYAMHYPEILKYWGPAASLSEFPGERANGELQKIKTSSRLRKYANLDHYAVDIH